MHRNKDMSHYAWTDSKMNMVCTSLVRGSTSGMPFPFIKTTMIFNIQLLSDSIVLDGAHVWQILSMQMFDAE
jgi:hypothetical protein